VLYINLRPIAAVTRACHGTLSRTRLIQSTWSHPLSCKIRFNIIILPSARRSLRWSLPSWFCVCMHFSCLIHATCLAHLPSFLVSLIVSGPHAALCAVKVKLPSAFSSYRAPSHEGVLGEWVYSSTHSLTSPLDGGEWSASRPGRFTPRERVPGTHWIGC
jgi:hypothetical protein